MRRLLAALALLAPVLTGQDPLDVFRENLDAGRIDAAGRALLRVLGNTPEREARYGVLGAARETCARAGRNRELIGWLGTTRLEDDPVVRHFRGWLLLQLKLLGEAREDLRGAAELLGLLAARAFRLEEAARRYASLGGRNARWGRHYDRLARSSEDAARRQALLLLLGAAAGAGILVLVGRRLGRA